ncbi:SDR family oxidoreductase [Sphingomonas canadensis]|uniref:SDR family oxidoreductase n=1 Tax=Sphingomonas canadensis TaxID=1219257 RepID=A0ABW3HAC7_9SPHN|nr:SDR family oxidoreductase [Sphingomonas canadensis]MCW3838223.1 SDR family oxidoreductase [Sphingomonas canadensis]
MTAKAIFITGGASGIGQAVAKLFADRGWRVGLADVNEAGLAATAAMLPAGMATTHVMDVRDRAAWEKALGDFTAASGGRLDVLFNNAGIANGGELAEMAWEDIDRLVAINITGVINGAKIGYAYLKATPGSCLVNTSSAAGIYGSAGLSIYSAGKFAVRGLSEALDAEWYPAVKVRALMPSFIDTPLLDTIAPGTNRSARETVRDAGLEFTPLPEVAQAVWDAVQGDKVHAIVGKTARQLAFAAKWMPGALRKRVRSRLGLKQ